MKTASDWLTVDYTTLGWGLRILALGCGSVALLFAFGARRGAQKRFALRWGYRADIAIALIGIVYEIAIPVLAIVLIIGIIGACVFNPVESDSAGSLGCLVGSIDFFDFFDLFDSGD